MVRRTGSYIEKRFFKHEQRSGSAENEQRLTAHQVEDDAHEGDARQHLADAHPVVGLVAQQTAERDGGREAGEVEEDEDADALQVERVADVGPVQRHALLEVADEPSEQTTRPSERVVRRRQRFDLLLLGLSSSCTE